MPDAQPDRARVPRPFRRPRRVRQRRLAERRGLPPRPAQPRTSIRMRSAASSCSTSVSRWSARSSCTTSRSWRSRTAARGASRAAPAAASGRRVVDLSHVIREGLVTYPGLPAPTITSHLTREDSRAHYAPGTEFAMDIVTMIGNTGTYLDSPYHRYDGGTDLAGLELASLVDLPAEVFHLHRLERARHPGERLLRPRRARQGRAAAHRLGPALRHPRRTAATRPSSRADGVAYLVEQGAVLVGIDSLNIDEVVPHGERPAHSGLLARRHPRRGAPHEPRRAAAERRALHGRAAEVRGVRHLPGAGVRDRRVDALGRRNSRTGRRYPR